MSIFLFILLWILCFDYIISRRNDVSILSRIILCIISILLFIISNCYINNILISIILISFIYISYTDITYYLIYDEINLNILIVNFIFVILYKNIINYLVDSLILIILYIIIMVIMKYKKCEFIGGGDLKLIFAMNGFCGILNLPFVLFTSSFLAIIFTYIFNIKNKKRKEIYFGPFLCLGYLLIIIIMHVL